jgi:ATP-dependent DNA helicase RecG
MLTPDAPIQTVPKIGPKYKDLLQKLDIYSIEDLLYHFPFRYDDYAQIKHINDVIEGEHVTVQGVMGPVNNIFTRNGKKLTRAEILDHTGKLQLVWFNQHYVKNSLLTGKRYYVSGTISSFDKKLAIFGPEIEEVNTTNLHTGRLVPIYPETYGVSSKWLRTRINDIVGGKESRINIEEIIPQQILEKNNFQNRSEALKNIHFPDNKEQVEKARERFGFEEMFVELLNVEKRKQEWKKFQKGQKIQIKATVLQQFYQGLPFELSESQNKAIAQILEDLAGDTPMNRLIEGDVGSGKTIVALAAAYANYLSGLRSLYLAPTEILAKQHFDTFVNYLATYGVKCGLATGSTKSNVEDADILVGTHALLHAGKHKNVGLVIIDEQHRFGVEQRGKLLELAKENLIPNLLTLTATPIPRTLALTLYGDLDISVLESPKDRKRNVETKILPDSKREETYKYLSKNPVPTFIVCPLIDESESESLENVKSAQTEYENVKKYFPANTVGLLHGRMKPQEKQDVINSFTQGKIRILVATPVIEVGIDIPDAAMMIIESGERYGLASLHQLRGRVGRNGQKAYCVVFMSNFSKVSYERLKNLETIDDGLKLAEIDLKNRGEGDIFSTMQHGYRKFKVASLDNLKLLESAKVAAEDTYPSLKAYPNLMEKLKSIENRYIRNN